MDSAAGENIRKPCSVYSAVVSPMAELPLRSASIAFVLRRPSPLLLLALVLAMTAGPGCFRSRIMLGVDPTTKEDDVALLVVMPTAIKSDVWISSVAGGEAVRLPDADIARTLVELMPGTYQLHACLRGDTNGDVLVLEAKAGHCYALWFGTTSTSWRFSSMSTTMYFAGRHVLEDVTQDVNFELGGGTGKYKVCEFCKGPSLSLPRCSEKKVRRVHSRATGSESDSAR